MRDFPEVYYCPLMNHLTIDGCLDDSLAHKVTYSCLLNGIEGFIYFSQDSLIEAFVYGERHPSTLQCLTEDFLIADSNDRLSSLTD